MSSKPRRSRLASRDVEGAGFVRHARIEQLLHHELQSLIRDEAGDPSLEGVIVLAVHLSPDSGHARIPWAVVGNLEREQTLGALGGEALRRATPFFRARLAEELRLKKLPQLSFTFVGVTQTGGAACE